MGSDGGYILKKKDLLKKKIYKSNLKKNFI